MPILPRDDAIQELKNRNLIPEQLYLNSGSVTTPRREAREGGMYIWNEPIPGNYPVGSVHEYSGINTTTIPFCDHDNCMVEVHICDGFEWRLNRVIFSQTYAPSETLKNSEATVTNLGLRMTVVEDIKWYNNHCTLCMYRATREMNFATFRRTFRYWLILHMDHDEYSRIFLTNHHQNTVMSGVLPHWLQAPRVQFFDTAMCADLASVRLGLGQDDTLANVFDFLISKCYCVELDTFTYIWYEYRACLYKSTFVAIRFVAKLKHRVLDRKQHAPGGAMHTRHVEEWGQMVNSI